MNSYIDYIKSTDCYKNLNKAYNDLYGIQNSIESLSKTFSTNGSGSYILAIVSDLNGISQVAKEYCQSILNVITCLVNNAQKYDLVLQNHKNKKSSSSQYYVKEGNSFVEKTADYCFNLVQGGMIIRIKSKKLTNVCIDEKTAFIKKVYSISKSDYKISISPNQHGFTHETCTLKLVPTFYGKNRYNYNEYKVTEIYNPKTNKCVSSDQDQQEMMQIAIGNF